MGMKERPPCFVCGKPSLVLMYNKFLCGDCVTEWNRKQEEKAVNQILEDLK